MSRSRAGDSRTARESALEMRSSACQCCRRSCSHTKRQNKRESGGGNRTKGTTVHGNGSTPSSYASPIALHTHTGNTFRLIIRQSSLPVHSHCLLSLSTRPIFSVVTLPSDRRLTFPRLSIGMMGTGAEGTEAESSPGEFQVLLDREDSRTFCYSLPDYAWPLILSLTFACLASHS